MLILHPEHEASLEKSQAPHFEVVGYDDLQACMLSAFRRILDRSPTGDVLSRNCLRTIHALHASVRSTLWNVDGLRCHQLCSLNPRGLLHVPNSHQIRTTAERDLISLNRSQPDAVVCYAPLALHGENRLVTETQIRTHNIDLENMLQATEAFARIVREYISQFSTELKIA